MCQDAPPIKKKQLKLEPLPALSAYQEWLHHDIHGPAEPLPPNLLAQKTRTGCIQPLQEDVPLSPLPPLPGDLEQRQRAMEGTVYPNTHECVKYARIGFWVPYHQ